MMSMMTAAMHQHHSLSLNLRRLLLLRKQRQQKQLQLQFQFQFQLLQMHLRQLRLQLHQKPKVLRPYQLCLNLKLHRQFPNQSHLRLQQKLQSRNQPPRLLRHLWPHPKTSLESQRPWPESRPASHQNGKRSSPAQNLSIQTSMATFKSSQKEWPLFRKIKSCNRV